jgi:hypothetical protein
MEKVHCSNPEMYRSCRSCWITVLILPTHVFGEAIIETSKIHNLVIQYPNNSYFGALESSCKWEKRSIIFFITLIIVNSVGS